MARGEKTRRAQITALRGAEPPTPVSATDRPQWTVSIGHDLHTGVREGLTDHTDKNDRNIILKN